MPEPIFVNIGGKRVSEEPRHSGLASTFPGTLFLTSEPVTGSPSSFQTKPMSGAQLKALLDSGSSSVSLTYDELMNEETGLLINEQLGQYQGKQLIVTARVDAAGDPLPNVISEVLDISTIAPDAYTLELVSDPGGDYYDLQLVTYDPTPTTGNPSGTVTPRPQPPTVETDLSSDSATAVPSVSAVNDGIDAALAGVQQFTGFDGQILSGSATAAIGTGSKSVTVTLGLYYRTGDVVYLTNGSNWLRGTITSYNAGTGVLAFTVAAGDYGGSGSLGAGARVTLTTAPSSGSSITTLLPWSARAYAVGEPATAGGGIFVCKLAHTSSTSPIADSAWNTYWDVMSQPTLLVQLDDPSAAPGAVLTSVTWYGLRPAYWKLRNGGLKTLNLAANWPDGVNRLLHIETDTVSGNDLAITPPSGCTIRYANGATPSPAPDTNGHTVYTVYREGTLFLVTKGANYQ